MIHFFQEDIQYSLKNKRALKNWIAGVLDQYGFKKFSINYILCSNEYILKINRDFLQHDYYTDIITFNNSIDEKILESDIFISLDTIQENSNRFRVTLEDELHRVMIHGILHLLGYHDKTTKQKQQMRQLENQCLELRKKYYLR